MLDDANLSCNSMYWYLSPYEMHMYALEQSWMHNAMHHQWKHSIYIESLTRELYKCSRNQGMIM